MIDIEIPVIRNGECTTVTITGAPDSPHKYIYYAFRFNRHITIGGETLEVRAHLLRQREDYPEPPRWGGADIFSDDHIRVTACLEHLLITTYDEDGNPHEELELPWDDVFAVLRKIGVRLCQCGGKCHG